MCEKEEKRHMDSDWVIWWKIFRIYRLDHLYLLTIFTCSPSLLGGFTSGLVPISMAMGFGFFIFMLEWGTLMTLLRLAFSSWYDGDIWLARNKHNSEVSCLAKVTSWARLLPLVLIRITLEIILYQPILTLLMDTNMWTWEHFSLSSKYASRFYFMALFSIFDSVDYLRFIC